MVGEFRAAPRSRDGLHSWCKPCHNQSAKRRPRPASRDTIRIYPLRGGKNPAARHPDHDIALMRRLHADGLPQVEIMRKFEVSQAHVSRICNYLTREEVPPA